MQPPEPPPPRWSVELSSDPTERAFLEALRAKPDDEATRVVYADWLEQRGDPRAALVRDRKAPLAGDADWRRIAACARVQCGRSNCWGEWHTFEAIENDEQLRRCQNCELAVRYCVTRTDIELAAWTSDPYVIDAGIDRDEARRWHDAAQLEHARSL